MKEVHQLANLGDRVTRPDGELVIVQRFPRLTKATSDQVELVLRKNEPERLTLAIELGH